MSQTPLINKTKKVFYTINIGGYDVIISSFYAFLKEAGWDIIVFTDDRSLLSDSIISVEYVNIKYNSAIRTAKDYKIRSHKYFQKEYDLSLFADGNIVPDHNLIKQMETYLEKGNNDIVCYRHKYRDCIYQESDAIIDMKKDNMERVSKQIEKYRKDNFPEHRGLICSGCILRRQNKPEVIRFCEYWFQEVMAGSHRDQLCFNYVIWRLQREGITLPIINFDLLPDILYTCLMRGQRKKVSYWETAEIQRLTIQYAVCMGLDITTELSDFCSRTNGQLLFLSSKVPIFSPYKPSTIVLARIKQFLLHTLFEKQHPNNENILEIHVLTNEKRLIKLVTRVYKLPSGFYVEEDLLLFVE